MLTPIDIQSRTFKGGIGYDRKDVDSFVSEVVENYENLYKENQNLSRKVEVLTAALSQYKTIEKSLQKALLLAQKTADDIKKQAHASAKIIEDEARNRAALIISDSKNELETLHRKSLSLIQQYDLYRTQFEQLARTQMQFLKSDSFNIDMSDMERLREDAMSALDEASVALEVANAEAEQERSFSEKNSVKKINQNQMDSKQENSQIKKQEIPTFLEGSVKKKKELNTTEQKNNPSPVKQTKKEPLHGDMKEVEHKAAEQKESNDAKKNDKNVGTNSNSIKNMKK